MVCVIRHIQPVNCCLAAGLIILLNSQDHTAGVTTRHVLVCVLDVYINRYFLSVYTGVPPVKLRFYLLTSCELTVRTANVFIVQDDSFGFNNTPPGCMTISGNNLYYLLQIFVHLNCVHNNHNMNLFNCFVLSSWFLKRLIDSSTYLCKSGIRSFSAQ